MGIQINGQTDTITAIDGGLNVSGADLGSASAGSLNVTGIVTASGFSGNVTGNVNASGVSTFSNVRITGGTISGVSTAGITTAYVGSINDGPISGARNRIINGDMKIFQRGTATTIGASSVYALDRWLFGREAGTESARFTVTKESLTSSDTPFASDGTTNTMKIDITTASGGISASQSHYLTQRIEGFNVSDLAYGTSSAKSCVASFWIKADNKTGTMGVSLYNGGNRSYIQNISVTSSWTKYSLVFLGDTSGSIANDNTQQLTLSFALSAGSNLQNTANTWVGGFDVATISQADFTDSTSNNIYITGVQLEVGTVATPFERRSYGDELARCQRYYYRIGGGSMRIGAGYNETTGQGTYFIQFPTNMRTSVTSVEQSGTASDYGIYRLGSSTGCTSVPTYEGDGGRDRGCAVRFYASAALTAGQGSLATFSNSLAFLGFSAEL